MGIKLEPFEEVKETPAVVDEGFNPTPRQAKKFLEKVIPRIAPLIDQENPADSTESYLDTQAGKYVKMLEQIADIAGSLGMLDTTSNVLFGLLRMTKVGRQKADLNVTGAVSKLRDETNLKDLTDEEIAALIGRKKDAS